MAILQAGIAIALHSLGRIAGTVLGWATVLLFGTVPQERQVYLSGIVFASVIWMVVVIGIAWPSAGTWLLGFVTLPRWVNPGAVRLAMLGAAVLLPPLIGLGSLFLAPPETRPRGAARARAAVRGYRYTSGLAVALLVLCVVAPAIQFRNLVRRRTTRHVPVIIRARDYREVAGDVQRALEEGGLSTARRPAGPALQLPSRILPALAGETGDRLVASELVQLTGDTIEVLLYPFALMISGPQRDVARAQAILAEHLTFTKAYMTWTPEANRVEDDLRALRAEIAACRSDPQSGERCRARLRAVERQLQTVRIPYEEWEVLLRGKLLVERELFLAREPEGADRRA